jgi:hypothetical protein
MYLPKWKVHAKIASVNDNTPTPEEARSALAEVDVRALEIRRSDGQLRFILLAIAAVYLALGVVIGLHPRGGPLAGPPALAIFASGLALAVVLGWRVRAYSKMGMLRFSLYCSGFTVWNAVVFSASFAGGWIARNQPGWHFTVSAAVASIPLVLAAWLLAPRRG